MEHRCVLDLGVLHRSCLRYCDEASEHLWIVHQERNVLPIFLILTCAYLQTTTVRNLLYIYFMLLYYIFIAVVIFLIRRIEKIMA